MTEQGGALAGLRAAIAIRVSAKSAHTAAWNGYIRSSGEGASYLDAAERRNKEARDALAAELAAVEARIEAFRRFVRAFDEWEATAHFGDAVFDRSDAEELKAARQAISDEALA